MDGEQIRCGELFKRISEAMEKHGNSELQSYGVTFVQMQVLMELNSLPEGTATLKELEKRFEKDAERIYSRIIEVLYEEET